MDRLLQILLGAFIRRGNLRFTTAGGKTLTFGDGTGEPVAIRITSKSAQLALLRDPELKFGELYMDGRMVIEEGSIYDLLQLLLQGTRGEFDDLPLRNLRRFRTWIHLLLIQPVDPFL